MTNNCINLGGSGICTYNGSGTFNERTFLATSTKINFTNADGISGNPTIDANESNFLLNNIGGTLNVSKGGTASTSFNTYGPVVAGATSTTALISVSPHATTGIPFVSQGAAANPAFTTAVVAGGGTGSASFNTYGPLVAGATTTTALVSVSPHATTGIPFVSQGAAANPAFGTAVVAGGGTGVTSNTAYAVLCGGTSSTGAIQSIASVGSSGQTLVSNGAGALPTFQTNPNAWQFISTATASNSSEITFTGLSSTYFMYMVIADNIVPITDATSMRLRTSTDGGATYDSGANDYAYVYVRVGMNVGAGISATGDDLNTSIIVAQDCGTNTNERMNFILYIINPSNTGTFTFILGSGSQFNSAAFGILYDHISGIRLSAADVDAIQFTMSADNISTGTFKLYGLKAS